MRFTADGLLDQSYATLLLLTGALGTAILVGGSDRFSGIPFTGPQELTEWLPIFDPYIWWGLLFLGLGAAMVLSIGRAVAVHVLRLGSVVFFFTAFGFGLSAYREPTVAFTGLVIYSSIAVLFIFLSLHVLEQGWGRVNR